MSFLLFPVTTIGAAGTLLGAKTFRDRGLGGTSNLCVEAQFAYGSGGTACKVYVQTSFDQRATWVDMMCFAFTTVAAKAILNAVVNVPVTTPVTPTDGSLADNTVADGIFGEDFRVKIISTGTYSGATDLALWSQGIPLSPVI